METTKTVVGSFTMTASGTVEGPAAYKAGERVTLGDGAGAVCRRSMSATVVRGCPDGGVWVALDPERHGDGSRHLRVPAWSLTRTLEPRR